MRGEKHYEGKISVERLVHFQCGACERWWSIGDAPVGQAGVSGNGARQKWFCPWCGLAQTARVEK